MNNTFKYIALIAVFLVSAGGAFTLTKVLKTNTTETHSLLSNSIEPKTIVEDLTPIDTTTTATIINDTIDEAASEETVEEAAPVVINKMSASEFGNLLIHGNVGKNPRVARFVTIRTRGLREGDRPIDNGDVMGVYMKIDNEKWESIRVISVGYDDLNRINSVVIEPIYPKDQVYDEQSVTDEPVIAE